MPVFDTPVTTDDRNLKNVLGQNLPVALFLFDSKRDSTGPLDDALKKIARKHAGAVLVARVDVASNPAARGEYSSLETPALVTSTKSLLSRKTKSQAER